MAATIKTSVSIQKTLFDQVAILARQLNISHSDLFGIALEDFIKSHLALFDEIHKTIEAQPGLTEQAESPDPHAIANPQNGVRPRQINQGDIFWVRLEEPDGLEPGIAHPYVVLQENAFNYSRIHTLVVCALTTNIKQANAPGNVLLEIGEANLPKPSVVVVSKISSVDKTQLGEYIGSLTGQRISQILAGMQFLQSITKHHETG